MEVPTGSYNYDEVSKLDEKLEEIIKNKKTKLHPYLKARGFLFHNPYLKARGFLFHNPYLKARGFLFQISKLHIFIISKNTEFTIGSLQHIKFLVVIYVSPANVLNTVFERYFSKVKSNFSFSA